MLSHHTTALCSNDCIPTPCAASIFEDCAAHLMRNAVFGFCRMERNSYINERLIGSSTIASATSASTHEKQDGRAPT